MGKTEKSGERAVLGKMKQRHVFLHLSAHTYVSPSIGTEYAYVKQVHVDRNEDMHPVMQSVHFLSQHAGMLPVVMHQYYLNVWPAEGCGGATQVLVEAEGGGVRGADRSLSLPFCSLEGNKD